MTAIMPAKRAAAERRRGFALLLLSAFGFSLAGLLARAAPVDTWSMVFWRNLFGCAALLLVLLQAKEGGFGELLRRLRVWGWATVATSSLATLCFLAAFAHTSVADVAILYATAPLMTALLAWLSLGERVPARTLVAAILALVGVGIMMAGALGRGTLLGDALAFLMALFMSVMTVCARRHGSLPALSTAFIASLAAGLAPLPLGLVAGASFAGSAAQLLWLGLFGIATMAVALPCYLAGAKLVPAGQAMLLSALELPLSPLWVWLAFGERVTVAAFL